MKNPLNLVTGLPSAPSLIFILLGVLCSVVSLWECLPKRMPIHQNWKDGFVVGLSVGAIVLAMLSIIQSQ